MSFFIVNVYCAQSNHLNDVRIDCDWKDMILFYDVENINKVDDVLGFL